MSEENEEDEIAEDVRNLMKQNKKKIVVEHRFKDERSQQPPVVDNDAEGDDEDIRKKLQEREAQLAALALQHFNKEVEKTLEFIPEKKREAARNFIGEDPDKLKLLQFQYGVNDEDDDGAETPPPKGKVRKFLREPKTEGEKRKNVIEELYDIRQKKATTPEEMRKVAIADAKIGELFSQMIQGFKDSNQISKISIAQCSKCGSILTGKAAKMWAEKGVCSACGYDPHKGV